MSAYYPSFDVSAIDANGIRYPVPGIDVDAYNVTQSTSAGTVTADANGVVAEGSITGSIGDVMRFSVSGYDGVAEFTLQATQTLAFTAAENADNVLVIEDRIEGTTESEVANLYVTDIDDPTIPPTYIGSANAGGSQSIPYAVTTQKNLRLHLVARSVKGQQTVTDFNRSNETYDITVPGPSADRQSPLFDVFEDATTTGTTRETVQSYSMPTGVLDHAGDKIVAEYAGVFAANANDKRIYISFAGSDILDTGVLTENGTAWHARVTVMRSSVSEARSVVNFSSGASVLPQYASVTSLDLDANGYDLDLDAVTPDNDGDLTLKLAHGRLLPRQPQTAFGSQLFGLSLVFVPGSLAGGPSVAELGGLSLVFSPGTVNHQFYASDSGGDPINPNCFAAGTLVLMADGTARPIEDLQVNDMVMAWTADGRALPGKVAAFSGGRGTEYRRLLFADDVLECTPMHPFHTPGGKARAADLVPGRRVYEMTAAPSNEWSTATVETVCAVMLSSERQFYNWEIAEHHTYFVSNNGQSWKAVYNAKIQI